MNEKKRTVQFLTIIPYNWKIHRPYFNLSFFKIQFQILSTRFNLSSSKNAYISHLSNFSIQKRNSYNGKNYLARPGIRIDSINSRNETSFQQKLRVNRSRERRKKGRKKKKKKKKTSKHWRETVEIRILFAHRNSYQGVIASISERFAQRREPFSLSGHFVHFRSRDADEIHLLPSSPSNSFCPSTFQASKAIVCPFPSPPFWSLLLRLSVSLHYSPRNGVRKTYLKRPLRRCNYRLSIRIWFIKDERPRFSTERRE